MDCKAHGRFQREIAGSLSGRLLGEATRYLTDETMEHIKVLCDSRGLSMHSYLRWWLETNGKSAMYRNIVMSAKTDSRFLEWVDGQRLMASTVVKLEMDEIGIKVKTAFGPPEKLFTRQIKGVDPLVQFTVARYLGYPDSVRWLEAYAREDMETKPWLAEQLARMKDHLPEIDNAVER